MHVRDDGRGLTGLERLQFMRNHDSDSIITLFKIIGKTPDSQLHADKQTQVLRFSLIQYKMCLKSPWKVV